MVRRTVVGESEAIEAGARPMHSYHQLIDPEVRLTHLTTRKFRVSFPLPLLWLAVGWAEIV